MEVSEIRRLKALEDENRRLKQLIAEKELDIQGLKAALRGKYWSRCKRARRCAE